MTVSNDIRLAKAMAHPVRLRALHILNERIASPSDIAREIGLPVANVSYHINTLLRLRCIEEVETHVVRGAIEHMYRAIRKPIVELDDAINMPASVRGDLCAEIFLEATTDARAALTAGTVEKRSDVHWAVVKGELDAEAFANVHDILRDAHAAIEAEQEAARARLADGAEAIPWRLTIFHYEAPAT